MSSADSGVEPGETDVAETLETLREYADENDAVAALVELLDYQQREINRLRGDLVALEIAEVEALDERLSRLESMADPEFDVPLKPSYDTRDKKVLQAIAADDPDIVTARKFERLYQQYTDVTTKRTIRKRIKIVTQTGPFEIVDTGEWEFLGFPEPVE